MDSDMEEYIEQVGISERGVDQLFRSNSRIPRSMMESA